VRSLLQQLENNEAVLLMYLAGELPAEDRAEVEQLLANDGGLRAELARLRDAERAFALALEEADARSAPAATEAPRRAAAVRSVSRAIAEYHAERRAAAARDAASAASNGSEWSLRRLRLPGWMYPFAAAAVLLIGWVGYWGFTTNSSSSRDKGMAVNLPTVGRSIDEGTASALLTSLDPDTTDRQALASTGAEDPGIDDLAAVLRAIGQMQEPSGGAKPASGDR
jgi:anti-sigma factor RsiW